MMLCAEHPVGQPEEHFGKKDKEPDREQVENEEKAGAAKYGFKGDFRHDDFDDEVFEMPEETYNK